jgi:DNA invertase Pin-like site-specific DNA recombinase
VQTLDEKHVGLRICDFGGSPVDTKSPSGKLLLTVFGAIAEFERGVMLQRQKEGIAAAKAQGKYKGRKPTARVRQTEVSLLHSQGIGAAQIAKTLGIGRASVYRMIPPKDTKSSILQFAALTP